MDETLLLKFIQLVTEIINFERKPTSNKFKKTLKNTKDSPTNSIIENNNHKFLDEKKTEINCYFDVLEFEIGNIVLSG